MIAAGRNGGAQKGSILLPVIVVLLLLASAATAMTLQAQTTLREAATRRDRLRLGFLSDAVVRATALAVSQSFAAHAAPPLPLDGTPQSCSLPDGLRLVVAIQDEGGRVDLNKGSEELILLILQRAGLSGWDAKAATEAILRRRDPSTAQTRPIGRERHADPPGRQGFSSVDEIERMPGMSDAVFGRLEEILTVASGSSGVDPAVAAPTLKALVPMKELTAPALSFAVATSSHASFTIIATAASRTGTRVQRRATLIRDPNDATAGRFTSWDAPIGFDPLDAIPTGAFCAQVAAALTSG